MPNLSILEINGVPYDLRDPTKAPASGFESRNYVASVEDLNALIETLVANQPVGTEKTYYCTLSWYANAPLPTGRWSITIHKPDVYSEPTWAGVTATVMASQRIHQLQRELYEGTWLDWEWENPDMELGKEYRTTERWKNKAVYTKLVNCGKMPNNTQVSIPHRIDMDKAIRLCGYGGSSTIPYSTTAWNPTATTHTIDVTVSTYAIYIRTNYDASDESAMVQIWYTKD